MVRKQVLFIIIAVLAAGILLGTVFVFLIPDGEHDNRDTKLRIGFMNKIDSLNPYVGISESAQIFYGLVYDTLTCSDQDMNPSPNLAKSFGPVPVTDPDMIASGEPYGS